MLTGERVNRPSLGKNRLPSKDDSKKVTSGTAPQQKLQRLKQPIPENLSQLVVKWARDDLLYRANFCPAAGAGVEPVAELSERSVQRICKHEMSHVLNFLVNRVTSERKIVMQRHALLLSRLNDSNKRIPLYPETVDELCDRSAALIRSVRERIELEEHACRDISDRINAQEIRASDARNRIRNVRRRLYLKCAFRKSEMREVNVQKTFQNLFNLELGGRRTDGHSTDTSMSRPDASVSETTTSIRIKEICNLIKNNAEEAVGEKRPMDANFRTALTERIKDLMSSTDILVILHTLAALLDSASHKLRLATQTQDTVVNLSDYPSVEQCLHKGRADHVARFVETQRIRSETARIRERRRVLVAELVSKRRILDVCRESQESANPGNEKSKSASQVGWQLVSEKAGTVVRKAMEEEVCLRKKKLAGAKVKADELVRLKHNMETIEQEVIRRQDLICRLVEHNTTSRHRLAAKVTEMQMYARQCLLPYLNTMDDQVNRIRGSMIREVQTFAAARLDGMCELVYSRGALIEGSNFPFAEIGISRRARHPIVTDLRTRTDIPQYLAAENTLQVLACISQEGLRAQVIQRVYGDIRDFEVLRAGQLVSDLSITNDGPNVQEDTDPDDCKIVGRDLVDSAEQIRGRVVELERKHNTQEVPLVVGMLEEGKEGSKLCEDIGELIRERC